MKRFTDRIAGTMFGRDTVGITMDDLLKLEK